MRFDLFLGLSDKNGNPINWKQTKPIVLNEVAEKFGYATVFEGLYGVYTNSANNTMIENSVMLLIFCDENEAESMKEKIKEFSKWFLKETNQESTLLVINSNKHEFLN